MYKTIAADKLKTSLAGQEKGPYSQL